MFLKPACGRAGEKPGGFLSGHAVSGRQAGSGGAHDGFRRKHDSFRPDLASGGKLAWLSARRVGVIGKST